MFRRAFFYSGFLTFLLLLIFGLRQLFMSWGYVAGQNGPASELMHDFVTSPGAMLDIGRFLMSLVFVHVIFAFAVALAAFPFASRAAERGIFKSTIFFVFALFVITVLIWVSLYYPLTLAGFLKYSPLSSQSVAIVLSISCLLLVATGIVLLFFSGERLPALSGAVVLVLLLVVSYGGHLDGSDLSVNAASMSQESDKPNLVIIGIDALRPDHLGINNESYSLTPSIDGFLNNGVFFEQAFTPIARTYTAWFALLSGKSPKDTGIRYNLQPFDKAQITGAELQNVLKDQGYHTIYGMDERRFNNIDERYGFDQDIGPDFGAADFVLFHAAELPLVALVSNTPVGKWLFPMIYSNRGVYGTYMPETFTREVLETVSERPEKPLFLALHLTLPHWPFLYREFEPDESIPYNHDQRFHYAYQLMVKKADEQFSNILQGLEDQGVLDNAVVFLISDHGEGFMLERDRLVSGNSDINFPTDAHGHGTSVLDEKQYHVVLGMQDRRSSTHKRSESGTRVQTVVSLLDIAPTVFEASGIEESEFNLEGQSLFDLENCIDCSGRQVFIESSVATNAMFEEDLDMMKVMAEGLGYYTVAADGNAVVRDEVTELLSLKQRAVVDQRHIVAHYPGLENDFLVVDRKLGVWWPSSRYGGDSPDEVLKLMGDLCRYYKGDNQFDKNSLCEGAGQ